MESLSEFGRGGIRIQDCFLQVQELHLAWALESVSMGALAGDGTTGGPIGITTESCLITTLTYPTAEFSSITTPSIAPGDFMGTDFTVGEEEDSPVDSTDSPPRTANRETTPVPSAASITEVSRGGFPHAGSLASVEALTEEEAFMAAAEATAAGDTGKSIQYCICK